MEDCTQLFREAYARHISNGLEPNEAAAQTVLELQRLAGNGQDKASEPTNESVEMSVVNPSESHQDMEVDEPSPSVQIPAVPQQTESTLGSQLQKALTEAQESHEYRRAKSLIYHIFSEVDAVNDAFVDTTDPHWWYVNRSQVSRVFSLLNDVIATAPSDEQEALTNTLKNALLALVNQPWNVCSTWTTPASLRFFLVLFDLPFVFDPDYLEVTGGICRLFYHLQSDAKKLLHNLWLHNASDDELERLVDVCQQTVTVSLYGSRKMDLVYASCGVLAELHALNFERSTPFTSYEDFYNDAVNMEVDVVHDYTHSLFFYKKKHDIISADENTSEPFVEPRRELSELSFCDFPFVLDAASKAKVLHVDSDIEKQMRARSSLVSRSILGAYCVLRVRRDHLIEDALQLVVRMTPDMLKKPLKVKFVGEDGVDEGGVQKEFFQILIKQLLDPSFGMFLHDSDARVLWFNSDSLESTMEFELIGTLLGVAIYNGVILDLQFPHIVYKKLMQVPLTLEDIEVAFPELGKGLRQLLLLEGDVEEALQLTFEYSYEVFGEVKTVELKPGGSQIPVTQENKHEYVRLYIDYAFNKHVEQQYTAFERGFRSVADSDVLHMFRWEELQLLICGSPDLDFDALENVTRYEDGYTEDHRIIREFWSIVHELSVEDKKKFLRFMTGSDRVPIGGLQNLDFVISRNGPDSDRLPTAHTCFNHLLLPEYSDKDKMKERLTLAINNSEGFGLR